MGAWGTGIFENDAALDWFADLRESDDPLRLIESLVACFEADGSDGDELLVAAAAMAALGGQLVPAVADHPDSKAWLSGIRVRFDPRVAGALRASLDRLVDPNLSGTAELWIEKEYPDAEWLNEVETVASRLDQQLGREAHPLPRVPFTREADASDSVDGWQNSVSDGLRLEYSAQYCSLGFARVFSARRLLPPT